MPISNVPIPSRVAERAYRNATLDVSGCIISNYSVASHGYAQIGWQDDGKIMRGTTAHRAAWVHVHGQIPDEITVDHKPTCDRRCVNTSHLRLLTNFENGRRTFGRDWEIGFCINGHSNDHLKVMPSGRHRCRLCAAEYQRTYRRNKRAR